ncbi:MAG: DUF5050 domain-containing protein [Clostridiales bacterium]|nr:DUF5050 domain-containing protein [Clostridiales bacterium]
MKNILKKNHHGILIAVLILIILISSTLLIKHYNRFIYNDSIAVGNSAGNLYNMGLFCEDKGYIYFANPSDSFHLYSMEKDGTNIKKLNFDSSFSINVANNHVYYTRNNKMVESDFFLSGYAYGIYRFNLKNHKIVQLHDSLSEYISLSGNHLYFQEYSDKGLSFSKVSINDKNDYVELVDAGYTTVSANEGSLYYTEIKNNHNIYKWDTSNDTSSLLISGNYYQPSVVDGVLYAIDLEKDYSLIKMNLDTMEETTLSDVRCINYNVYDDYVFYQVENIEDPSQNGLFRMKTDASSNELVIAGNFMNINTTSEYTYFQYYGQANSLYRTPTKRPVDIQLFNPVESE